MTVIRLGTRRSQLALWQADHVAQLLQQSAPHIEIERVEIVTEGDQRLDAPLSAFGGKGLFLKEIDAALLKGEIDLAVHSMKDVPAEMEAGLQIAAICERADSRDALITFSDIPLSSLPIGARIGTCSLRRRAFMAAMRSDFVMQDLRGNVPTRIAKLRSGEYDAILLAVAGLERLGLADEITQKLSVDDCIPAIGQGAVGIACRSDDRRMQSLLTAVDHTSTHTQVLAERGVTQALGGDCHAPIAAHAVISGDRLTLTAAVGREDGSVVLRAAADGNHAAPESIGAEAGAKLIDQGALDLLAAANAATDS